MPSADAFLDEVDEKPSRLSADEFLGPPPQIDSGQSAAFRAADEQQALERQAAEHGKISDAARTAKDIIDVGAEGVARGMLGPASLLLNREQLQTPLASPEAMKWAMIYPKVADYAAEAFPDSQVAKYPKAVTDAMANTASGFTSPQNIGLLGVAPQSAIAQRLIAGTFLGQSIAGTPEQWQAFQEAKSVPEKIRIATEMGLSLALPAAGLLHANARAGEVPKAVQASKPLVLEEPVVSEATALSEVSPAQAPRPTPVLSESSLAESQLSTERPLNNLSIPVEPKQAPSVPKGNEKQQSFRKKEALSESVESAGQNAPNLSQMTRSGSVESRHAKVPASSERALPSESNASPALSSDIRAPIDEFSGKWSDAGVSNYISYSPRSNSITLHKIVIPASERGSGLGTRFMEELAALADQTRTQIRLTPTQDFGGSSVPRLKEFYKRFGFVENKGARRDLSHSETMYREPLYEIGAQTSRKHENQGAQGGFRPSTEWQEIPEGIVLPNGGEYRFDQKTGKNYARWSEENLPKETPIAQPEKVTEGPMEQTPTSTKNAVTDAERVARDIAPAVEAAKRDFGTVWEETQKRVLEDPGAPERLATEIAVNPRALSDHENALLLRRQIELQNEHDAAVRAVNEATDPAAKMDASARLERARDDLQTVYDATRAAGTETGRGLNARKMLANNDYSLAKMEATTRAVVNNGKALSPKQAADVKALHERIRVAEEKVSAYEAREQFETELKKAKAEARQKGFKPQSFLEQQAQRARERIVARRGKLFADPIGVTQIAHLADEAIIGASHIARGVTKFSDWSAQMVAELGDRIKPHLQALFAKAREIHSRTQTAQPLPGRADMLSRTAAGESRFERAIGGDKKRIQANIEKIEAKTAAGDFSKPKKNPPRMDRQKAALLFEFQKAKDAYNKGLIEAKLRQQSIPRKVLRYGGEMLNTTRAIMTSFDLSAVLRQGGFIAFGHPIRALRAFPDMIRALRSEQAQFRVMEDIKSRPNAPLYRQAKLYISDNGPGIKLSQMEEQYMSRWAHHIPGVGASERAYTTFLNRLRADSFDAMAESLSKGGKPTLDEAKAIANYINVVTGRGNLDAAAKAATGLNTFFFAPRYVVSRFQVLAGQPLYRGTGRTRVLIAKEYAKTLAGAAVVYALGQSAGATVSTDATSPDFMKLKFGNTRVDPLFGLSQATVFLSREGLALKRFLTQDQNKQPKYGSGGEVLGRFLRTKLAPAIGAGVDILSGKNVVGQKVTPGSVAKEMLIPLSIGDVYNAMKDQGVVRGTALSILAIFGMGVQNYQAKPATKPHSHKTARLNEIAQYLQAA